MTNKWQIVVEKNTTLILNLATIKFPIIRTADRKANMPTVAMYGSTGILASMSNWTRKKARGGSPLHSQNTTNTKPSTT